MKKGFTLIELLAVVVILAVIALIAIPIVVTLINDSAYSTETISAKSYANAVIETIMKESLDSKKYFEPDKCIINNKGNVTCDGVDLKIVAEGEKPISGFLKFDEGSLVDARIEFKEATIVMSAADELVNLNDDLVCVRATNENITTGNIPSGNFLPGDEYICEVKEDTKYNFFVIGKDEDNVNLILDRNINSDGTLVTKRIKKTEGTIYNIDEWISLNDYVELGGAASDYGSSGNHNLGPITAIKFIQTATASWVNIPSINIIYEDENMYVSKDIKGTTGYGTITLTGRARLPKFVEVSGEGKCTKTSGSCPLWLVNYMMSSEKVTGEGLVNIDNIEGYWTLSSGHSPTTNKFAVAVLNKGNVAVTGLHNATTRGIRPVISVPKADIY